MAIFNSYVSSPEGRIEISVFFSCEVFRRSDVQKKHGSSLSSSMSKQATLAHKNAQEDPNKGDEQVNPENFWLGTLAWDLNRAVPNRHEKK